MRIFSVALAVGLLVFLGHKAMNLYRLTVCRQEAWRSSVTLQSRTLLTKSPSLERDSLLRCRILVMRKEGSVFWMRIPGGKKRQVGLVLKGTL